MHGSSKLEKPGAFIAVVHRTCSFQAVKGKIYCGNHILIYDDKAALSLVACPFGPEQLPLAQLHL